MDSSGRQAATVLTTRNHTTKANYGGYMPRNAKKHLARSMSYNAQKASQEVQQLSQRKAHSRCDKALNGTLTLRSKDDEYPPIYTQKAKYQKVANEFGRQIHAIQKVRGSSIPLI